MGWWLTVEREMELGGLVRGSLMTDSLGLSEMGSSFGAFESSGPEVNTKPAEGGGRGTA